MKVLLINGSSKSKGCTYTALTEVEKQLQKQGIETEIFHIGTKAISGCLGCGVCHTKGRCFMKDSVNEFLDKVAESDAFVFGSPVHFASASGNLTSFMDRVFFTDLASKAFNNKPAAAVISARRAGTTATFDQINKYFTMSNMPIVSSQYWNMVHGATPDQVKQDLEGLQTMRTLGRNMAFLLKCKEAGLKNGVKMPEQEAAIFTNFIR